MKTIAIEKDERGVAVLALNRPDKHNAMSAEMIAELTQAAVELGADTSVRAVVLTGTGASFCAGGGPWLDEGADERLAGGAHGRGAGIGTYVARP